LTVKLESFIGSEKEKKQSKCFLTILTPILIASMAPQIQNYPWMIQMFSKCKYFTNRV